MESHSNDIPNIQNIREELKKMESSSNYAKTIFNRLQTMLKSPPYDFERIRDYLGNIQVNAANLMSTNKLAKLVDKDANIPFRFGSGHVVQNSNEFKYLKELYFLMNAYIPKPFVFPQNKDDEIETKSIIRWKEIIEQKPDSDSLMDYKRGNIDVANKELKDKENHEIVTGLQEFVSEATSIEDKDRSVLVDFLICNGQDLDRLIDFMIEDANFCEEKITPKAKAPILLSKGQIDGKMKFYIGTDGFIHLNVEEKIKGISTGTEILIMKDGLATWIKDLEEQEEYMQTHPSKLPNIVEVNVDIKLIVKDGKVKPIVVSLHGTSYTNKVPIGSMAMAQAESIQKFSTDFGKK